MLSIIVCNNWSTGLLPLNFAFDFFFGEPCSSNRLESINCGCFTTIVGTDTTGYEHSSPMLMLPTLEMIEILTNLKNLKKCVAVVMTENFIECAIHMICGEEQIYWKDLFFFFETFESTIRNENVKSHQCVL